jgi:hypothetical protein
MSKEEDEFWDYNGYYQDTDQGKSWTYCGEIIRVTRLLLFSSKDGVEWSQEAVVDVADSDAMQPYSSFVDFDGPSNDCSLVDGSFYIYYPRKRFDDHEYDYMYCRLITVK